MLIWSSLSLSVGRLWLGNHEPHSAAVKKKSALRLERYLRPRMPAAGILRWRPGSRYSSIVARPAALYPEMRSHWSSFRRASIRDECLELAGVADLIAHPMRNPPRIWLNYRPVRIGWLLEGRNLEQFATAASWNTASGEDALIPSSLVTTASFQSTSLRLLGSMFSSRLHPLMQQKPLWTNIPIWL